MSGIVDHLAPSEAVEAAERAVERARTAQAAGRSTVEAELPRLDQLQARLTLILDLEVPPTRVSPAPHHSS